MMLPPIPYVRALDKGMGEAVAQRTVLRKTASGDWETWGEVATRVAAGNVFLTPDALAEEYAGLRNHIAAGRVAMSGRHLQHGDVLQSERNMELFTNCSTAASSFMLMLLLLQGSGVGRSYDDELMLVDWDDAPDVKCVLDASHPDADGAFWTPKDALLQCPGANWFRVPDSREGWAKSIELIETAAFERARYDTLVLDFSDVRPKGAPIAGMQNRPSSGPVSLMLAIYLALQVKGAGMARWEQAMRVDHALASCVAVGGARRAARMAMKSWKDPGILEFIDIKRRGGLWTANNSVAVDKEFWKSADVLGTHANRVFTACVSAQYHHGSGEPGLISVDKLHTDRTGLESFTAGSYIGNNRYTLEPSTHALTGALARVVVEMQYPMIVNPCAEIAILALGGYCCLADWIPFHCDSLPQALEAVGATARALVRVNTMPAFYGKEVARTNRIGVSFTGVHEFAWQFFGLSWKQLVDESKSRAFWDFLDSAREHVEDEATVYSRELGLSTPHTFTTVKPAGSTSKLWGVSEGAHLPAMRWYMRWVQFQTGDPLIAAYESRGYPVKYGVTGYDNVAVVGFPTCPIITTLGIPDDEFVTAPEATMEDQYEWLRLIEKHWLGPRGNQVSYTLKYNPSTVDFPTYRDTILANQPTVRCCAVMPSSDWRATEALYGYVPEQPLTRNEYIEAVRLIDPGASEAIDLDALACASGACPL